MMKHGRRQVGAGGWTRKSPTRPGRRVGGQGGYGRLVTREGKGKHKKVLRSPVYNNWRQGWTRMSPKRPGRQHMRARALHESEEEAQSTAHGPDMDDEACLILIASLNG